MNGGAIAVNAGGRISTNNVYSRSDNGSGGEINFSAYGDITITSLQSSTDRGNGGNISITSETGQVTVGGISSGSYGVGNGGLRQ